MFSKLARRLTHTLTCGHGTAADQLARWKPATAHNRYRGLHSFFTWAASTGWRPHRRPSHPFTCVRRCCTRICVTGEPRLSRRRDADLDASWLA